MIKIILLPLFFLCLPVAAKETKIKALPVSTPEEVGMSPEVLAKIDPALEELIEKKKLAGGSVLILREGKIVYQKQFGHANRAAKVPMKKDTIFRIYSMTKAITSAAALMLYEEKKLNLDDPITRFLPEFALLNVWQRRGDPTPAKPMPTIRDLLRHTAGFSYGWGGHPVDRYYGRFQPLDRDKTLAEMSRSICGAPLLFQPGTRWHYGINTDILGRVIEVASGQTFDAFLQQRFFAPLGMSDTGFYVPAEKANRLADVYQTKGFFLTNSEPGKASPFLKKPANLSGGGGLVSTINDYARFLQMIANGGNFQGKRYLKADTVKLMTTNQLPDEIASISLGEQRYGTGFGLGFSVRIAPDKRWAKDAAIGEYGWGGMASTHYWISPKDKLVVVTMEQTLPYNWNLERLLKPIVYQAIKE
ncbi:beta-lactamase family protein [bacterium]|nr:beta-lactamase family protein [Verrucomicrobiota bacterium]MDA7514981.1 beta-lactamase family protein [Akkermansiaceae bacterium]MDA7610092.1 beta-lactamase family protein [bacterium]MDA7606931.1 beta-lactamase family protein [Akkermansiaceae bacterium]MDA7608385.1 beta-lactamase family protein [Akkermansiaceae bacterium]